MSETSSSITVTLNGKPREIPGGLTVRDLIDHVQAQPETTLVERNGVALFKREWPDVTVEPGDSFEFVQIVAGG